MLDTDIKNLRIYKHEKKLLIDKARRIHRRIYQLADLIDKLEHESRNRSASLMIPLSPLKDREHDLRFTCSLSLLPESLKRTRKS